MNVSRTRRGQTTTEYIMVIAIVSVALALAMAGFFSTVYTGTDTLSSDLIRDLTSGGAQH